MECGGMNMKYDENDNLLYFSTEQSTSYEEKRLVIDHMARTSMDILGSAFKEGGVFRGGASGEDRPKNTTGPIAAVAAIIIFLGVIGGVMSGSFVIAAVAAGIGLFILSIVSFLGNNNASENKYSQLQDNGKLLTGKAGGVALLAFSLACLIPAGLYVAMDMESSPAVVLGIGCFLVATVITSIANIISGNNKAKNVYTGTVSARCIGYLKKTRTSSSNSRHGYHRNRVYIVGTPIFEFDHMGVLHKAFLNEYSQGRLKPAYGEQVELNINPENPDDILYLPFLKKRNVTNVITGIICLIFAVLCFWGTTIM